MTCRSPHGGVATVDGRRVDLADLCAIAYFRMSDLPGRDAARAGRFLHLPARPGFTSPYGFHGCALAIDTLTGELRIDKYVVVSDVGRVITPALLAEQVRGGVAQGLGEALFEEIALRHQRPPGTRSLFDYRMPRALDMPRRGGPPPGDPGHQRTSWASAGQARTARSARPRPSPPRSPTHCCPSASRSNALPIRFAAHPREASAACRGYRRRPVRPGGQSAMKLPPLDYVQAADHRGRPQAWSVPRGHMFLAGGQGLLSEMGQGLRHPATLVDISAIPEFRAIEPAADGIGDQARRRGPAQAAHRAPRTARIAAGRRSPARWVAPVRSLATVGGNFCHGHPTSELPLAALVAGAA